MFNKIKIKKQIYNIQIQKKPFHANSLQNGMLLKFIKYKFQSKIKNTTTLLI